MKTLVLALLQVATGAAPVDAPTTPDIVVVATRLKDLKQAVDDCLARRCPPKEDIDRSLIYAHEQFIAGDYAGSRRTLEAARHRNARFAKTIPLEVSGVQRAAGHIYGRIGYVEQGRFAMINSVEALKAGLPPGDARIAAERLEVADTHARSGEFEDALHQYDRVLQDARRRSLPVVEGMALFRRAALLSAVASVRPGYRDEARRTVKNLQSTSNADIAPFRNASRLIEAQLIGNAAKRLSAVDQAIAHMDPIPPGEPVLLYTLPFEMSNAFGTMSGDEQTRWMDVGFRVTADGRVSHVSVERQSKNIPMVVQKRITDSVAGRRYMPMALGTASTGVDRVDRYSIISDRADTTGSHMNTPGTRRIEVTDVSGDYRRRGAVVDTTH